MKLANHLPLEIEPVTATQIEHLNLVTKLTQLIIYSNLTSCFVHFNQRPEIVEDFVRNFLVKMGMSRTLDCFQTEWYVLLKKKMVLLCKLI